MSQKEILDELVRHDGDWTSLMDLYKSSEHSEYSVNRAIAKMFMHGEVERNYFIIDYKGKPKKMAHYRLAPDYYKLYLLESGKI